MSEEGQGQDQGLMTGGDLNRESNLIQSNDTSDNSMQVDQEAEPVLCTECSSPTDIKCNHCQKNFHFKCIPIVKNWETEPLPGDLFYTYSCDTNKVDRLNTSWRDILAIGLFNVKSRNVTEDDYGRKYLPLNEVVEFIERNLFRFRPKIPTGWKEYLHNAVTDKWFCTIGGGLYALEEYDEPWKLEDQEDDDEGYMKRRRKTELDFEERKRRRFTNSINLRDDENVDPANVLTMYYDIDNNNDEKVKMSRQPTHSAPQVVISSDGLKGINLIYRVTNEKGYRLAKASHGVWEGHWYFEFILDNDIGNCRLGWSQISGDLQAPCGYDTFSYSYRANPGTLFHNSKKVNLPALYDSGFKKGDIMGCYIHLGKYKRKKGDPEVDPNLLKRLWDPEKYIHYTPFKSKPLPTMPKSYIEYFKNGYSLGKAFLNLGLGKYHPAVSLYNGASGTFNFGPDFIYPPLNDAYGMYRVYELDTWEETLEKFRIANEEIERAKREARMKKLEGDEGVLGSVTGNEVKVSVVVVKNEDEKSTALVNPTTGH